jgi:NadR type nicotinamide-nucleotide adenylyltransferase
MTKNAVVLMTALVPTVGHKYLIDFASKLVDGKVVVILSSLNDEPINGSKRVEALYDTYAPNKSGDDRFVFIHHRGDRVPQQPSEHPDFWNIWADVVRGYTPYIDRDEMILVASEKYGAPLAIALGCEFVPCDIARQIYPVKSTNVRSSIIENWNDVLPAFKHNLAKRITLFGPESTGKTTMAKKLAAHYNGQFLPEWAREYLELKTPEATDYKMEVISKAQYASQQAVYYGNLKHPFIFQDTDLLTTLGYYDLWYTTCRINHKTNDIVQNVANCKSELYIVMNDGIPFEPDVIRYGGDHRESKMAYWIRLLTEHKCNYYVVKELDRDKQLDELTAYIDSWYANDMQYIANYVRR